MNNIERHESNDMSDITYEEPQRAWTNLSMYLGAYSKDYCYVLYLQITPDTNDTKDMRAMTFSCITHEEQ